MATKSPKRTYKDISEMPKGTTWISDLMDCTTTILTAPANHLAPSYTDYLLDEESGSEVFDKPKCDIHESICLCINFGE